MKYLLSMFAVLFVTVAFTASCAAPEKGRERASMPDDVAQAIDAATAARMKAAAIGGEWRDTASLIAKAKEAAGSGDYTRAMKLAVMARREGELGHAQAIHERKQFEMYKKNGLPYQ
jgi:hypothetical protein